ICSVFDVGEHDGRPFLVMERMKGRTLREEIGPKGLPVERVLALGVQIADALEAAHRAGIVHRDLKPSNVFVTERGDAKLLDFGLAKSGASAAAPDETVEATVVAEERLTSPGATVGTVTHMSPEQARGEVVDGRTDIFSLGVVLYEMATGRLPFTGRTQAEIFDGILNQQPTPPTALDPAIPADLERAILKALEKERDLRYQHAAEIRADLQRLQRDSTAADATGTSSGRPVHPSRRRLPRGVLGSTLVALAALTIGGLWVARRGGTGREPTPSGAGPAGPKRIAVLPFENLGTADDAAFTDGMAMEVRSKLSALPGLLVIASPSSNQYRATTKPVEQVASELGVSFLLVAKVQWQKSGGRSRVRVTPELVDLGQGGAPTTRWQESFEGDLADVFRVQGEIATKVARSLDVVLSGRERDGLAARPTSDPEAWAAYVRGKAIDEEGGVSRASLSEYEKAVALDPGFALAWAEISLRHNLFFDVERSQAEADAARKAAERAVALAPSLARASVALVAYRHDVLRDEPAAEEVLARALEKNPEDADLLRWKSLFVGKRDPAGRLELLREIDRRDPRRPEDGSRAELAWELLRFHRAEEARAVCDRGLAVSPKAVRLVHAKAMACLQDGDLPGARGVLAAARKDVDLPVLVRHVAQVFDLEWVLDEPERDVLLRLTPAMFGDDEGEWAFALLQAASRRHDAARVRELAELARKSYGARLAKDPGNGYARAYMALSLAYLGRKEEAVREGERAAAGTPVSKDARDGSFLQHLLVRIHVLCGNDGRAIDLLTLLLESPYFLTPGWLRIDPGFDPLRGDPRFERLARGG
ncbi:hypothetical protein FBQ97_05825, partial [Acidobacteria bacterium ACD]|nr:hypothetical protein [Acidobacteria bacterium ACD]